ncbi:unnamed protein product [Phytomonas sp. EM1]|nr:unnamed protein product [Phytomonas sp. EM1]|eukprot:CCW60086.1 unnamed protein product [Phytomonas sp. isolate EM1]
MLFMDMVFLVSPTVSPSTVSIVRSHGARVVYAFDDSVTCGIQAASAIDESRVEGLEGGSDGAPRVQNYLLLMRTLDNFPSVDEIRNSRLFIVYECWVVESALHGHCLPLYPWDTQRVAYHPFSMRGLSFTTSQLPRVIKANVVAALQYCGAHYTTHLDGDTQFVVHSKYLGSRGIARQRLQPVQASTTSELYDEICMKNLPLFPAKALVKTERSSVSPFEVCNRDALPYLSSKSCRKHDIAKVAYIPCVTPGWVELCVRLGRLLPFSSVYSCNSFISSILCSSSTLSRKRQRE